VNDLADRLIVEIDRRLRRCLPATALRSIGAPALPRLRVLPLSRLSVAAQGSAYLLTHRSWMTLIGTGFRKWSFSRPRLRVVTRFASSSTFRCFITPKRDIGSRASSAVRVCPSCS